MNKAIILLSLLAISVFIITPVSANSLDTKLSDTEVEPKAYTYLTEGLGRLSYIGDGSFYLYGRTSASQNVSEIEIEITLQRWNGSVWVNLTTYSNVNYNSNRVTEARILTVPTGHYYRLFGKHTVRHGITEVAFSYTSPIYAN